MQSQQDLHLLHQQHEELQRVFKLYETRSDLKSIRNKFQKQKTKQKKHRSTLNELFSFFFFWKSTPPPPKKKKSY